MRRPALPRRAGATALTWIARGLQNGLAFLHLLLAMPLRVPSATPVVNHPRPACRAPSRPATREARASAMREAAFNSQDTTMPGSSLTKPPPRSLI